MCSHYAGTCLLFLKWTLDRPADASVMFALCCGVCLCASEGRSVIFSHTGEIQDAETLQDASYSITMLQQLSMILRFEDEVIRKRTEALKEEKEMERVRAKRQLDFLDILLLSRVRHVTLLKFPFKGPTSCLSLYSSRLVKQEPPSCGSPGHNISGVTWD